MTIDEMNTTLSMLEESLQRVEAGLVRLRGLAAVEACELHNVLQDAVDRVDALGAYARQLADLAGIATPSWHDRESYLAVVDTLQRAIARRAVQPQEQARREAIARVIEQRRVEYPQPRLRAAYQALVEDAAQALREALDLDFEPLKGPEDPVEWVRWARTTPGPQRGTLPRAVADFLDEVPEKAWRIEETWEMAVSETTETATGDGVGEGEATEVHPSAPATPTSGPETMPSSEGEIPQGVVASEWTGEPSVAALDCEAQAREGALDTTTEEETQEVNGQDRAFGDGRDGREVAPDAPGEGPALRAASAPLETTEQGARDPVCVEHPTGDAMTAESHGGPSPAEHAEHQTEPEVLGEATLPLAGHSLDDELRSFEAFRERRWYAPSGRLEPAPWIDERFAGQLVDAFVRMAAQEEPPFHRLWAMTAAAQNLGDDTLPRPEELVVTARLWHEPSNTEVAHDPERVCRLRTAMDDGTYNETPRTRLLLVLEALAPSYEMSIDEVEDFTVFAGFRDPALQTLVGQCLRHSAQGEVPLRKLREILDARNADPDTVASEVRHAREALREKFLRVQHAGGGNIEHTHCRQAWSAFIRKIEPQLHALMKLENPDTPDFEELAKSARQIADVHKAIADKHDAKLKDRHKMDRHAERLRNLALELVGALRKRSEVARRRPMINGHAELKEAWQKLHEASPVRGDEAFARRILLRVVERPTRGSERDPFGVSLAMWVAQPDLVACFDHLDLSEGGQTPQATDIVVDVRETTHPRHLAALWLQAPAAPAKASLSELLRALEQRSHLQPFLALLLSVLSDAEQRIHAMCGREEEQRLRARHARLLALWQNLSDLASSMAGDVRTIERVLERTLEHEPAKAMVPLYGAWIDAVIDRGEHAAQSAKEALLTAACRVGAEVASRVRRALDEGRCAEAHRLMHDTELEPPRESLRQTMFRWEACRHFDTPFGALRKSQQHHTLIEAWCRGVTGDMHRQDYHLRTAFKETFFRADNLQPHNNPSELRVPCEQLREWLKRKGLNPSYVPQLARYRDLVVLTPPAAPHDSRFVQNVGEQVAKYEGHLVVVLAPRLTERVRGDVCTELRRRHGGAGVVDDLDLCRILNLGGPEPNLLLALLEVILEQQRWASINPFMRQDGQHVQMEMFVGRREEARELARTSRYSRLFSGRRLGKSALLRFIEATEDGHRLPSGRTLRVLYVSAVGVDSERALVRHIEETLVQRFELRLPPDVRSLDDPRERLKELFRRFRSARSDDSLLVVLDEADTFVEQQIEAYERERERCLSFFMRSDIEKDRDSQGLPYVRFVFSGYRATHTSQGAWANWGDVLRLAPLVPDEAADLVARPLARLGIDARRQMRSIAHRCGYQPAVLHGFGERLLAQLEQQFPITVRDERAVEVSDADVALTFEHTSIQEEIRTVVGNNFQGNPVGRVVFGAVLRAFLGLPLGHALSDAPNQVLAVLRKLSDDDLGWLAQGGSSAHDTIQMHLRDLVERQLLIELRVPGRFEAALALRFPHHLSTLEPLCREQGLREEIQSLKRLGTAKQRAERSEVISLAHLQQLREFGDWQEMRVLPVVASLWPEALLHDGVGLPDRLGIDPEWVIHAPSRALVESLARQERRILVHGVSPEHTREIVQAWPKDRALPVVLGGADLLRWALQERHAEQGSWGEELYVEPFAPGRWSLAIVTWWFTRVRGVNFPKSDALEVLQHRTGGVPFLLRLFDELLFGPVGLSQGQDVGPETLERALDLFERRFDSHVRRLRVGDDAERLQPREIEILEMVEKVHQGDMIQDATNLRECLMELWDELFRASTATQALRASEGVSLAVLQELGLLPVRTDRPATLPFERLVPLEKTDVLFRVVRGLREDV